ncbi:hypothetical protein UlMin_015769 [Ulmus minor]
MQQPPGFETKGADHLVCKLHKSLYGLKQAPRTWFDKLKNTLIHMGFSYSKADNSLFLRFNDSSTIFLLVYVDDIIVAGSNEEELATFIRLLHKLFSLKDLGDLNYFLGIEVKSATDSLLLSQKKYIADLLKKSKMDEAKPLPTPMVSNLKLTSTDGDPITNGTEYRSIVGALQYITITRPEIAYSVNRVCQFMQNPLTVHWKAVKRILRYLKGTMDEGILIRRSKTLALTGYCDADWGNDLDNRRSTTGYCIYLGNSLVSWSSKKQPVISRSSTEAEYRSLANATSEVMWIQSLLGELKVELKQAPTLWCDNTSTISLSANPVLHSRTKHVELDLYFVREKVISKQLDVQHVPSIDQVADILTKPLSLQFFNRLKGKLNVSSLLQQTEQGK